MILHTFDRVTNEALPTQASSAKIAKGESELMIIISYAIGV